MRQLPLLLAATGLLAGCPDREVSALVPDPAKVEFKSIPVKVNRNLDLLFVIDNSNSMKEEQDSLRANFPRFINILSTIEGGLPDVHIGVVSSDVGTNGGNPYGSGTGSCTRAGGDGILRALTPAHVGGMTNVRYISDIKNETTGMRVTNYSGAPLSEVFSDIANVGDQGCGFEMHLRAMQKAIDPAGHAGASGPNTGFIRDNAYLAVVVIADEDDCSVLPDQGNAFFGQGDIDRVGSYACFRSSTVCDGNLGDQVGARENCRTNNNSRYHEKISAFIKSLQDRKGDPSLLIVAGIIGNSNPVTVGTRTIQNGTITVPALVPSCQYQGPNGTQRAYPGVRLETFLRGFPQTTTTTICNSDLSGGLEQIARLLKTVIGSPCMDSNLALPPQCNVSDVVNPGKPTEKETRIPPCDDSHSVKPCWTLDRDTNKCAATATQLALNIDRGGAIPADGTYVQANCVTE